MLVSGTGVCKFCGKARELQSVQTEMSTIDSALAQNRSLHDVYRAHFQEAGKVTERMKALNRIRSGQEQVHLHRT